MIDDREGLMDWIVVGSSITDIGFNHQTLVEMSDIGLIINTKNNNSIAHDPGFLLR